MNDSIMKRAGKALGLIAEDLDGPVLEGRSELPIGTSILPPPRLTSDTSVSADRALSLAAVYRAAHILSTSVSQMPVGVWRGGSEIDTPSLVNRPNLDLHRTAFIEQTMNSLSLYGNAYWLLHKSSPQASTAQVEVLNPQFVYKYTDEKGKTIYRYSGDKTYQAWQIKHLQLLRIPGCDVGLGPIQAAQNELRGAIDLRNYADQWFRNGDVPSGVLSTDQTLTPEMADAYADRWARSGEANGRRVKVLGNGLGYQPVYLSPKDAMFIESQQFSTTQVARLFGIPATYLLAGVEGNSMTYTNMTQIDAVFVKYTLMAYVNEIEAAFTDLLPRGQEAKFKMEAILRGDQKTRFDAYSIAIEAGFLTVDEVRAKEGMLPLPASAKPSAPVAEGNTNKEGETE